MNSVRVPRLAAGVLLVVTTCRCFTVTSPSVAIRHGMASDTAVAPSTTTSRALHQQQQFPDHSQQQTRRRRHGTGTTCPRRTTMLYQSSKSTVKRSSNKSNGNRNNNNSSNNSYYKRKNGIPVTEQRMVQTRRQRQMQYENITTNNEPSIWSFESLFPEPVLDARSVQKDLYGDNSTAIDDDSLDERTSATSTKTTPPRTANNKNNNKKNDGGAGVAAMRLLSDPKLSASSAIRSPSANSNNNRSGLRSPATKENAPVGNATNDDKAAAAAPPEIDFDLTRMVEDRVYGFRRTPAGDFEYDTSLLSDGAVSFRQGVRLGNPLRVNADILCHNAKQELRHGKVEEAAELYQQAVSIDPRDGRGYLGLSKCAQRRRDFALQRKWLVNGVRNSVSVDNQGNGKADRGANPFLLQALGCLEEKCGRLSQAEALYKEAALSRPSHAAAWVALAQIRTRKLGCPAAQGRICFAAAERELAALGKPPSSYVYTAWANLEYKLAHDPKKARELFVKALDVDPKCSAAFLQLGVLEGDVGNWQDAEDCFERVLKFDQRNSRVLQAYALMETKRPEGDARKALGLFERAAATNPRDAGVLQAYALYVAELGDLEMARTLFRKGTKVNKRDAAVWQAWGVLETRFGDAVAARDIFQQGIWSCGQLTGSQSGGYHCARLWQAWGVLEAGEAEHAAARRCFSRALDANSRNVPAVTAWALMEEELGNVKDARMIFERALRRFSPGSADKMSLWRTYELMEQRLGHVDAAQGVYQRSMREKITATDIADISNNEKELPNVVEVLDNTLATQSKDPKTEVEVQRWEGTGGEVWMNDRAIEGKVPMKKKKNQGKKRQ